ncbi:uncharacterized protein LOC112571137 [Pomacea canaliculata]|uniref:uncharacterized protein LOC112571137 n=1 Tax=Pomacea canaliculata TaxID=400727 RepID=UPI000D72FD52|nr:uncharacterized protein LOC112571137 [Pomacea canaliculata]
MYKTGLSSHKVSVREKEIHEDMVQTPAEDFPSYVTVNTWAAEFKRDRVSTEDDPRSGQPKTSTTDDQVDVNHRLVLNDGHITVQQIAKSKGISSGSAHTVLTEILEMSKLPARWGPRKLKKAERRWTKYIDVRMDYLEKL